MALFERGQALATRCQEQLDAAELKIEGLLAVPRHVDAEE
jgi:exodeoxyribonuclease VII small subunit